MVKNNYLLSTDKFLSPCYQSEGTIIKILKRKAGIQRTFSNYVRFFTLILKSVTIMNVIFSKIEGKLCILWCRPATDDSEYLEYQAEPAGEWFQTFRSLPSSQARNFCLEMMASRFFWLSVTIHSVASQMNFIPQKNRCENFSFRILCSPRLYDIIR
jgi:hypothetical protein